MYSLKFNLNNLNLDNIIFSKLESRPSKTLIDTEIFKCFMNLKIRELIVYDIFNLENNKKDKTYFLLNEILNKLKIEKFDDFCFSFDNLNINELDNYNIIFAFESKINQNSIIENYLNILDEINENDIVIINFDNLYYYSNLELILIFSSCFKKFYIYFSKILKQDIIIFKLFKNEEKEKIKDILLFLKNKINNKIFIKQIGFNIDNDIIKYVKNYNTNYMKYYFQLNKKISKLNLINFQNNLYEKYYLYNFVNKNNNIIKNCNHKFEEFQLENCLICKNCYELFVIY